MDINKLTEKYKAGQTTLEEEQFLFKNASDSDANMAAWFKYAELKRKQNVPPLGKRIEQSIQKKTLRLRIGMFAAAASILLLAFFSVKNSKQDKLTYKEKEATLKEALAMLSTSEPKSKSIIYEDELVIIYTSPE